MAFHYGFSFARQGPQFRHVAFAALRSRSRLPILPRKDGSVGSVAVYADAVVLVLDQAYATALVEGPGVVTESTYDAELAKQDFADALAALPGEHAKFLLYFLEGNDELTPESEGEIGVAEPKNGGSKSTSGESSLTANDQIRPSSNCTSTVVPAGTLP